MNEGALSEPIGNGETIDIQDDKFGTEIRSPQYHKKRLFRNRSHSFEAEIFEGKRLKVTVMGDSGVGKSCIISRFLKDQFLTQHLMTVEDLYRGEYEINNERLAIDILDTSGAYSFPAMRSLAIDTSDAFVLVYSVDKPLSFDKLRAIQEEILERRKERSSPIVVVRNKTDVDKDFPLEVLESCKCKEDWGKHGYVETSALTGANITKLFEEILLQCKFEYALSDAVDKKHLKDNKEEKRLKKRTCIIS